MWTDFLLGFGAAILNTPHCLGMCGGFPLHLAKSSRSGGVALRQALFLVGKSCTYIFLGAIAASLGVILLGNTSLARLAPVLRLIAGIITLVFGLLMLGFRLPPIKALQGVAESDMPRRLFGSLFDTPHPLAALVLGLAVGFLPCPLPMGMLAVAATSHSAMHGVALMAGVAMGTAPALLSLGLFGVGLDRRFARIGMRAAGLAVVVIALLAIGRSTGIIHKSHPVNRVAPPCCRGGERH